MSLLRSAGVTIGKFSEVSLSTSLKHPRNISVGDDTVIGRGSSLICLNHDACIIIGNKCLLTNAVNIYSAGQVIIDDFAMLAAGVFVADTTHCYEAGDIPYSQQGLTDPEPVTIHMGAWIGQNSIILPGCSVGYCSIVGANSVVTKPVPDYSIAVGSPARVIKKFSKSLRKWCANDYAEP